MEVGTRVTDQYNLGLAAAITAGFQSTTFVPTTRSRRTSSLNVIALAFILLFLGGGFSYARPIVIFVACTFWAIRLWSFTLHRVLKRHGDSRFDNIRSSFGKLGLFYFLQTITIFSITLPLVISLAPVVAVSGSASYGIRFGEPTDIVGLIFWAVGFTVELVADIQKFRFNKVQGGDGVAIMNEGLWNWSRHPNYFGEVLLWWGVWIIALIPAVHYKTGLYQDNISASAMAALKASVVGPLFITFVIFFLTGFPIAEKLTAKRYFLLSHGAEPAPGDKWAEYKRYLSSTSIFWPIHPALYRSLPISLKRTIFLDFSWYRFNEEKDGRSAIAAEATEKRRTEAQF